MAIIMRAGSRALRMTTTASGLALSKYGSTNSPRRPFGASRIGIFALGRSFFHPSLKFVRGKVVFTSREHIIALEARGKGLLGITLRYPYEVRNEVDYFGDIPHEQIPKDMLDLASHIVKTKEGHFDPSKFEDQYEDALKELLKKKQEGKPIERPERPRPTNVVNLMEALRRSVETSGAAAQSKRKAHEPAPRAAHEKEQSKRKKTRRTG
jgi:DNA end-binding protein Ku